MPEHQTRPTIDRKVLTQQLIVDYLTLPTMALLSQTNAPQEDLNQLNKIRVKAGLEPVEFILKTQLTNLNDEERNKRIDLFTKLEISNPDYDNPARVFFNKLRTLAGLEPIPYESKKSSFKHFIHILLLED